MLYLPCASRISASKTASDARMTRARENSTPVRVAYSSTPSSSRVSACALCKRRSSCAVSSILTGFSPSGSNLANKRRASSRLPPMRLLKSGIAKPKHISPNAARSALASAESNATVAPRSLTLLRLSSFTCQLLDQRIRIALMFGDFRRQACHISVIQLRARFLQHGIAQHFHQPLLPVLHALFQRQVLLLQIRLIAGDCRRQVVDSSAIGRNGFHNRRRPSVITQSQRLQRANLSFHALGALAIA